MSCSACCAASAWSWSRTSPSTTKGREKDRASVRLTDYLDKGASLGPEAPCLTTGGRTLTYFDVQRLSWRIAPPLDPSRGGARDKGAIFFANHPVAFALAFGISPAGAGWCPVHPRQ